MDRRPHMHIKLARSEGSLGQRRRSNGYRNIRALSRRREQSRLGRACKGANQQAPDCYSDCHKGKTTEARNLSEREHRALGGEDAVCTVDDRNKSRHVEGEGDRELRIGGIIQDVRGASEE